MTLTAEQRLNLAVILGNLECGTLAETRAAWALVDELELTPAEREAIGLQVRTIEGREAYQWNRDAAVPPREYDFSEGDRRRLSDALEKCTRYVPGQVRGWLEPLLAQLAADAPANGDGAKEK